MKQGFSITEYESFLWQSTIHKLQAQFSLGGELRLSSFHAVEVAGKAAVVAVAGFFLDVPVPFQIGNGALDRAFGHAEIGRDGLDPRPAFTFGGGHALEVHVDRLGPMWQAVVGVDRVKITDLTTSYVLTCEAGVSVAGSASSLFLAPLLIRGGYFA